MIELENVDNDYVRFEFHRPGEKEPKWELGAYLNCRFAAQGGAFKLRPKPPLDLGDREKFEWYLQRYDEVLVLGYLDAPLSGDYGWAGQYKEGEDEYRRLSAALSKLAREGLDPDDRLMNMLLDGNPEWMDEVRGLLAEREAGEKLE